MTDPDLVLDQDLIRRYKAGELEAFAELQRRYADAAKGVILLHLNFEGDSWLQEILDQAWARVRAAVDQHEEPAREFGGLVRTRARFVAIDHLRKRHPRPPHISTEDLTLDEVLDFLLQRNAGADTAGRGAGSDSTTADTETRALLVAVVLAALKTESPPHQALAFILVKVCDLTPRWIEAHLADRAMAFLVKFVSRLLLAEFGDHARRLEDALGRWQRGLRAEDLRLPLRAFVPAGTGPAAAFVQWWFCVKRRLYARIGWAAGRDDDGWRELLAEDLGSPEGDEDDRMEKGDKDGDNPFGGTTER